MRPVSDAWAEAIAAPHRIATRLTLIDGDAETVLTGKVDGRVDLDSGAAIRGRCDVAFVNDGQLELVPSAAASPLAPYGNEIRVERGISYPDGTEEMVSLGVFRIFDVEASKEGAGVTISVSGLDRASRVIAARFEEAGQIAAGTLVTTAILELLQSAYPDIVYDFAATDLTTLTSIYEAGDDPWALAQKIAASAGMELYFDGDGEAVLRPVPTALTGQVVADLIEGEGGLLVSASKRWTREGAYNRAIATGENLSEGVAPVRGVATDDNPLSPTYYFGPFGKVPTFFVSELLATADQAADAAAATLARQLGTSRQVNFGSVVNPALEPSDVVRIACAGLAVDDEFVIDTLAIPLGPGATMTGTTRATQVTS